MPANTSSLDSLSAALAQPGSKKLDKPLGADKGGDQREPFKAVIKRSADTTGKSSEKTPQSASNRDTAGTKAETQTPAGAPGEQITSDKGTTATAADTNATDVTEENTPVAAGLNPEVREPITAPQASPSLLPPATVVVAGGENLPPSEAQADTALLTPGAAINHSAEIENPAPTTIPVDIQPSVRKATDKAESERSVSETTPPRFINTEKIDQATVAAASVQPETPTLVSDKAVTDNIPVATKPNSSNARQTLVEVADPIKLSEEAAEISETPKALGVTRELGVKPTTDSGTPTIPTHLSPTQRTMDAVLANKVFEGVSMDSVADKSPAKATAAEAAPLIKLSAPPADHGWVQQFQTVHAFGDAAKSGGMQLQLPLNIHNPQWFAAMADRVSWLASQSIQAAEIHLDPPELGPLQVRIAVNQDQASVNFVSHQPAVRDMLDAQLMRLRELFANEGLNLIDVNVSDRHQRQDHPQSQGGKGGGTASTELLGETSPTVPISEINHWVDYYV